jgi:hypothetical protein
MFLLIGPTGFSNLIRTEKCVSITLGNSPIANVLMPTGNLQLNLSMSLESEMVGMYVYTYLVPNYSRPSRDVCGLRFAPNL